MLSGKYQSEQAELDEKIERLQSAIATESQNAADAEKWIALMKECVNPTELTAELLNTLIEKSQPVMKKGYGLHYCSSFCPVF